MIYEYKHFKPSSSHQTFWEPPSSLKEYIVTKPLGYLIIRWKKSLSAILDAWFDYRLYHGTKKHNHIFSWTVYCYAMDAYTFVELIAKSDFWWVTITLDAITGLEAASHKQQLSIEASWCPESYLLCKSVCYFIILWDDSTFRKKTYYLPVLNIYFPWIQSWPWLCQSILLSWSAREAALPLESDQLLLYVLPPQFVPLMRRGINTLPMTAAQQTVMFRSRSWKKFMQITCQLVNFSRRVH